MYDCYANEFHTISYAKRFAFESQTFCQTFQSLFTSYVNLLFDLLRLGRVKVLLLNIIFLINIIKAINQLLLIEPDVNYSLNIMNSRFFFFSLCLLLEVNERACHVWERF